MAEFDSFSINNSAAYKSSFGIIEDKTPYVSYIGLKGQDLRPGLFDVAMKGLTAVTGGAGSTDKVLNPVYLDPRIVDVTRKFTPLVEMIPRVTNQGIVAAWNKVTAKSEAFFEVEGAALDQDDDTYERESTDIKYLYAVGKITGQAQASIPSFLMDGFRASGAGTSGENPFASLSAPNAMSLEVLMKAQEIREKEEWAIVNGDASARPKEFSGIIKLQGTVNGTDLSGADLTYKDIAEAQETAFTNSGQPTIAVCSPGIVTRLKTIMIEQWRYGPADWNGDFAWGVGGALYIDGFNGSRIQVIPSQFMDNTTGSRRIYFLDLRFIEMRVLQDMSMEKMGKTIDGEKFFLKIYEALIFRNEKFNSFIYGIK